MYNHTPILASFSANKQLIELDCDGKRNIIFRNNTMEQPTSVHNFQQERQLGSVTSLEPFFSPRR